MQVQREITLPRPREAVWEAIASPERLGAWLEADVEVELRAGAEGTIRPAGGEARRVSVVEVVEGERLRFRWWGAGEPETRVELSLADAPGGTTLTVVESPVVVVLPLTLPCARPAGPVALAA